MKTICEELNLQLKSIAGRDSVKNSRIFRETSLPRLADSRLALSRFTINISQPRRGIGGHDFRILIFDRKIVVRHLMWHLLFRGITMVEWFILFRELEFQLKGPLSKDTLACWFGVLNLASKSRKTLDSWDSRTKPLHRILTQQLSPNGNSKFKKENISNLLDYLTNILKVPKRAMPTSNLYDCRKVWIDKAVYPPAPYIGVGYKDGKSKMKGQRPEPEPDKDDWLPNPFSEFSELQRSWTEIVSQYFSQ